MQTFFSERKRIFWVVVHTLLEMMPISSTAHIQYILPHMPDYETHILHAPAACVFFVYLTPLIYQLVIQKPWRHLFSWVLAGIIACGITVVIYLLLYNTQIQSVSPLYGMLVTAGLMLLTSYMQLSGTYTTPHLVGACVVGIAQGVAIIPGISRLAITYAAGRLCHWHHTCAFQFSCALAVPAYVGYWMYASGVFHHPLCVSWTDTLVLTVACIGAYGLLWMTSWLLASGRSWYFSLYVIFVCLFLYTYGSSA